jgi:hypothetical protein
MIANKQIVIKAGRNKYKMIKNLVISDLPG